MSENIYRTQLQTPGDRVISALDDMGWIEAVEQAEQIGPYIGMGKTNSLHQRHGSDHSVATLAEAGLYSMYDAKFHDIPNTVKAHVREVTQSGAALITVHASGGFDMLRAAVEGREEGRNLITDVFKRSSIDRIGGVLGITVLTSLKDECVSIFGEEASKKVVKFADLALEAGLDGIVCSTEELEAIRSRSRFDGLLTVVPGITPKHAKKAADQKRTGTPGGAISAGADMLVIGRGINKAADYRMTKAEAAEAIAQEVAEAL